MAIKAPSQRRGFLLAPMDLREMAWGPQGPLTATKHIDKVGAGGGTRTPTSFRTQDFKSCASTSSATPALVGLQLHHCVGIFGEAMAFFGWKH